MLTGVRILIIGIMVQALRVMVQVYELLMNMAHISASLHQMLETEYIMNACPSVHGSAQILSVTRYANQSASHLDVRPDVQLYPAYLRTGASLVVGSRSVQLFAQSEAVPVETVRCA